MPGSGRRHCLQQKGAFVAQPEETSLLLEKKIAGTAAVAVVVVVAVAVESVSG